jgi:hypothetical protein
MSDQPATRPLPNKNTEQTQTDIHASSGIRTHGPSVRASEDSSCLRPRSHCDQQIGQYSDRLWAGWLGFSSQKGQETFLYSSVSRPTLGPTQHPIQWEQGELFQRGKAARV